MNHIYAIRLDNGNWAKRQYWEETPELDKAHIYSQLKYAKMAVTRNKRLSGWKGAEIIAIEVYTGDDEIEHMKKFYAAANLPELIRGMAHQIDSLQHELQKYRPKTIPVTHVRA